ncbi:MAG: electron transfer flavoprotein subunit alpha/FixB family protein [Thermoplasmataceae archaeon]|jgi:electron transfer flavoprotein alpha subunit
MNSLVYSDSPDLGAQIISKFREFGSVSVLSSAQNSSFFSRYGPASIYTFTGDESSDLVSGYILSLHNDNRYDLIAIGSTVIGRETAGIVSAAAKMNPMAEISEIRIDNGKAYTKRFYYGGKTLLEEESDSRIFTIPPGISEPKEAPADPKVQEITPSAGKIKVLEKIEKKSSEENIEKASVIVSIGRGLGNKDGIQKIEPLAKALNGVIAGSRPVCLDYQWLSEEKQVGLSGKKVRPKLYVALGISGQIQHIAGMRGSKVVVAVNKDKSAPIFEESDFGIVGDLYQVVPKLVEALKN